MKILAVIFSMYFLGLSFVPCEDSVEKPTLNVEFSQDLDADDHSSNEADDCSPFCQCHCCHVHVVTGAATSVEAVDLPISTLIIQNGQHKGFDLPDYHFQPPRV